MTLQMLLKRLPKGTVIDRLIIDEFSMVYHSLLHEVLTRFVVMNLIIVGDHNQLQPIKWGNTLKQLIMSGLVPHTKLKFNYRSSNKIITFDKDGDLASTEYCELIPGNEEDVVDRCRTLLSQSIRPRDIIVITPTNAAVDDLNHKLQDLLVNMGAPFEPEDRAPDGVDKMVDKQGRKFYVGDKVILLKNNYDIGQMNGDIGTIIGLNRIARSFLVEFANKSEEFVISTSEYGRDYSYHGENFGETMTTDYLALAHAITIHKSQGSQWPYVIVYVPPGRKNVDFFNFHMIYTAISRTMMRAAIIGDIDAVHYHFNKFPGEKIDHLARRIQASRNIFIENE